MLNPFFKTRNGHVLNLGFYPDYIGKNIINSLYVCFVTNYCTHVQHMYHKDRQMHGLFSLPILLLKKRILKACHSSCKGGAGDLAQQQSRNLKGRGLVFIKPRMGFQRGTCQCQMHVEVRELRAENCGSVEWPETGGQSRQRETKQKSRGVDCVVPRFSP